MKGSITVDEGVDGGEATTTEEANPALEEPAEVAPTDEESSTEGEPTTTEETTAQE
jgi:hypothetical protein